MRLNHPDLRATHKGRREERGGLTQGGRESQLTIESHEDACCQGRPNVPKVSINKIKTAFVAKFVIPSDIQARCCCVYEPEEGSCINC